MDQQLLPLPGSSFVMRVSGGLAIAIPDDETAGWRVAIVMMIPNDPTVADLEALGMAIWESVR